MPNLLASLEQFKRAAGVTGSAENARILRALESASRLVEQATGRRFIPETKTRLYRWPPHLSGSSWQLWLNDDLLSVSALKTKAQNTTPTTIAAADYFLEPHQWGPPYNRVEIDLSSTSAFEGGDTGQRSISVLGSWGYSETTESAGALAEVLDATETDVDVTNASLIDVGDTILIESEQMDVKDRAVLDTTGNLTTSLTADKSIVTVAVNDGTQVKQGEVIVIESERMYVESISSNNLTVVRAYDGSVLAAHTQPLDVYAYRTLTVTRGVNGTTAATHANATAISRYLPPLDVRQLALAEAINMYHQDAAGWGRSIGTGEGGFGLASTAIERLRRQVIANYERNRPVAAV